MPSQVLQQPQDPEVSVAARWLGRILSGLAILFLLFDGAVKLVPLGVVTEAMDRLGYGASETLARSLGAITVVCTLLYAVPPTSFVGAILLTGYLGGAIACTNRRSLVHPCAVRLLSRPDGVGWPEAARSKVAPAAAIQDFAKMMIQHANAGLARRGNS